MRGPTPKSKFTEVNKAPYFGSISIFNIQADRYHIDSYNLDKNFIKKIIISKI